MPLWIPITLFAAFAQNLRFMLQRHLSATELSTAGATFARFLYSAPIVAVILLVYTSSRDLALPDTNRYFWLAALTGGAAQILATMCVVALFAERTFAIGITFKKTEVMLTALIGFLVLGESMTTGGLVAIFVGFAGVILLSDPPNATGGLSRLLNRGVLYGVASGALFGVSSVGYRAATLELDTPDVFLRASMTLACVTASQTIAMAIYLRFFESGEIRQVLRSWRVSGLVGLTSLAGSLGWFTAFALQSAAYVKALGQIELVFSFIASTFVFRERTTRREVMGVILIAASVLILILTL
jgi:drug/metabolite transporter (DMT)-like permease